MLVYILKNHKQVKYANYGGIKDLGEFISK